MTTHLIVGTIPGPALPFDAHSDLNLIKIEALQSRLDYLLKLYNLRCAEVAELRRQIAEQEELCAGLADDLEACYALQDQGAEALAALAAQEVGEEVGHVRDR
jgi:hypothetical protein